MADNKYSRYLDERTSSRYSQRLQEAQDEPLSPIAKVGIGVGLGLFLGAAALSRPGQRAIAGLSRRLPRAEEMSSIERVILNRHYGMQELRRGLLAEARQQSIFEHFGKNAAIHDALVDIVGSGNKNVSGMFLSAAKAPEALAHAIMSSAGDNIQMSREQLIFEIRKGASLNRQRSRELATRIMQFRETYDEAMLSRFSRGADRLGIKDRIGLRHVTVGDVLAGNVPGFNFTKEPFFKGIRKINPANSAFQENILKSLVKRDRRFENLIVSPGLFRNAHGEIVDLRSALSAGQKALDISSEFHLPFVGISPYDVFGLGRLRDRANMPFMHIFKKGEPQFIFDAVQGRANKEVVGNLGLWRLKEDMVSIGDKLYSLSTGKVMAENIGLAPSQWGRAARIYTETAGLVGDMQDYATRQASRGRFASFMNVLDIGNQESHSFADKVWNAFRKFKNKSWEGNLINQIVHGPDGATMARAAEDLKRFVHYDTRAINDNLFNKLFGQQVADIYGQGTINLSTEEGIMRAFETMVTDRKDLLSKQFGDNLKKQWTLYTKDPYSFMQSRRGYGNKFPDATMIGEFLSSGDTVAKSEDLKKLIQQELMAQIQSSTKESPLSLAEKLIISDTSVHAKGMAVDFAMSYMSVDDIRGQLSNKYSLFGRATSQYMDTRAPWYSYGPMPLTGEKILQDELRGSYLLVNKTRGLDPRDLIKALNGSEIERAAATERIGDFFGQFYAGRKDMSKFTNLSMEFYNTPFGRIQEALSYLHLGLGPEHTGSAGALFGNMITRRYFPAMLGIGLAGYLSWELGNAFGKEGDEIFAETKQAVREGYATVRDAFGITGMFKRAARIMPGSEFIGELPLLHFLDPSKSAEEVREEATQPRAIRKGRWWLFGNTPFVGGKIAYYAPSEIQEAKADPRMTDVLYWSEEEYYRNAWFPTPRYPLAPIRHFITDPYHWERKHYYDRPYPTTGGISELEDIPIAGPLVSGVFGRLLKPVKQMHQEELRSVAMQQIADMNEAEFGSSGEDLAYITPSGMVSLVSDVGPLPETVEGTTASGVGYQAVVAPTRGSGRRAISGINHQQIARALDKSSSLNSRILLPTRRTEERNVGTLEGAVPTSSLAYGAAKTYYGITEMAGLKGFFMQSITGQPIEEMKILQDSSKMTSYSRAFWDLELGGLGGESSEIGRRFIPRQRRFQEDLDINPIPNTMPSWMPGEEYFINFRTGDPYQKVPRGEARLPGAGFEAIHDYHPGEMVIRASQAGKSESDIIKYLLNIKEALPSYVEEAMEEGTEIHRRYQQLWRDKGILVSAEEEVYDEMAKSTGHYDAVIRTSEGNQVADIKTLSTKRWNELVKQGRPFEEHVDQVMIYMHALNLKKGGIFYATREENPKEMFFPIEFSEKRYNRIVNKLEGIRANLRTMIEERQLSPYELYDPLHRFLVLADVAPYSPEYKYYAKYVSHQYADLKGTVGPEREEKLRIQKLIADTKDRVSSLRKQHRFFPYRFKNIDLEEETVHVTDVLTNNTFLTKEYPDTPIRFAGIRVSDARDNDEIRDYLSKYIRRGARIKIGLDKHESERDTSNVMGSMKAVVFAHGQNLNLRMMRAGIAKEDEADWSSPGVHARFSETEIMLGSMWESFAHMDTPFHSKFLPVRSPLEEYKRKDIYGKSFQQWSIEDQLIPTIQGIMSKDVIGAALSGAILGGFSFGKSWDRRILGAKWGAAIFAGLALTRESIEFFTGEPWIPKRRIKEREINEYFDILEYIKYRGLYDFAVRQARQEGFDVEKFYENLNKKGEAVSREREAIEREKRELLPKEKLRRREAISRFEKDIERVREKRDRTLKGLRSKRDRRIEALRKRLEPGEKRDAAIADIKAEYEIKEESTREYFRDKLKWRNYYKKDERLTEMNKRLEEIAQSKELVEVTDWGKRAIQYRQRYESTLYGADTYGGLQKIMGALPAKEREYFAAFLKAKPEEREEILDLVPRNQRRFLQAAYGMEPDERVSLREYFKTHYLPSADWEGWSENKDLQDVKLKVVKNEGLDLSEFGFWRQDQEKAEANNAPSITIGSPAKGQNVERDLAAVLKGVGLTEVDVVVEENTDPGTKLDIQITKDRRQEIADYLNNHFRILS